MANEFVTMNPYDDQLEKLRQRQRMADLLQQQALQPLESQVAPGGYAVRTSPVLGLAKMLQAYMGGKEQRNINKEMSDIRDKAMQDQRNQEAETASAAAGITGRLFGEKPTQYNAAGLPVTPRPTEAPVAAPQPSGDSLEEITPTAKPMYDPTAALQQAMTPAGTRAMQGNPMLASLLAQTMKPKEPEKFGTEPRYDQLGRAFILGEGGNVKYLNGISAPESTKAPTTVGGMQYDPATKKWNPIPGYTEQAARIAAAGRPPVAASEDLSPEALSLAVDDVAAHPENIRNYASFGASGQSKRTQINNGIAAKLKDSGMTNNDLLQTRISAKANAASAQTLQKQANAVQAFEGLAKANGQRVLNLIDKLDATGVPLTEGLIRSVSNKFGSADAAELQSVLTTFQTEVGRILSNPNMTGTVSVTAQNEIREMAPGNMSAAQARRVINRLFTEMDLRKKFTDEALSGTVGRTVAFPNANTAAPSGPQVGTVEGGYRFKGGNPSDPKNWEKQ